MAINMAALEMRVLSLLINKLSYSAVVGRARKVPAYPAFDEHQHRWQKEGKAFFFNSELLNLCASKCPLLKD